MIVKAVHCSCGVELRDRDEEQLIRAVQAHASEAHDLILSDEQVRAMMFIAQDDEGQG